MTDLVETIISRKKLSETNEKTLIAWNHHKISINCSECTRYNQVLILIRFISRVNKEFKDVTKEDIIKYLNERKVEGKVKDITLDMDKIVIQNFYKYFYGTENYPPVVDWIKISHAYTYKLPAEMLTENEVKQLINTCNNLRDKVIVSLLYDSACRLSELTGLNVGDVINDGQHISIKINNNTSKSKKDREVGLTFSAPIMNQFLNEHPDKNNPTAPLFTAHNATSFGQRLTSDGVYEMILALKQRSGIKKRVSPHLFRHSRLSYLAKHGMSESLLRVKAGWAENSLMTSVYCHHDANDVREKQEQIESGVKPEKKYEKSKLSIAECPRCGKKNDQSNKFCSFCWFPMSEEVVDRDITLLDMLRSRFLEIEGVNIDDTLKKYRQFKTQTRDIEKMLECFNYCNEVTNDVIQNTLGTSTEECLQLLGYLVSAKLIDITDDRILLRDKNKYEEFLLMHKRYIEPSSTS